MKLGKHKESEAYEVYRGDNLDLIIEFNCPQCHEILQYAFDDVSELFEVECPHCSSTVQARLVLHMDVVI